MKEKYDIEMKRFSQLENEVSVPRFQRRLVWSKNQKEDFIETLKLGYPFGSILIYEYDDYNNNSRKNRYTLIDGLQRYTTIKEFKEEPQKYISFEIYIEEILELIIVDNDHINLNRSAKNKLEKKIKDMILDLIENRYDKSKVKPTTLSDKIVHMCSEEGLEFKNTNKVINDLQPDILEEIEKYNIDDIPIPTIVFEGSESELAEVFEKLNRGGRKLSKYQVFAAQWSKEEIELKKGKYSKRLLEEVIDRYNNLNESREVEIEDFDENMMRSSMKINLPEFCYGLGKLIINEMDVFWDRKNEDLINTIGYSTLALVLGIELTKLNKIIDKKEIFKNKDFLEDMIFKILEEYKLINNYFSQYLKYPGISKNRYESKIATNYQLLSYFTTLWLIKYEEIDINKVSNLKISKINKNSNYKYKYDEVVSNLIKYYLNDLFSGYWSGTGDSKVDRIRKNGGIRYLDDLDRESLELSLLSWWEERQQTASINFDNYSKALLVIHSNLNSEDYKELRYEIDHVFARSKLREVYKNGKGIPAGALGNMMFLEEGSNRSKQDFSLYDVKKEGFQIDKNFVISRYYPPKEEFREVENEIKNRDYDFIKVRSIIDRRAKDMINNLINNLYKE